MSLFRLATKANVGTAQLYRVCRGEVAASAEWLARVAGALGVDVAELVRAGLDTRGNVDTLKRREVTPMPDMNKEESLRMRIDAADRARLDALADHYALPVSAVVRMLAKRDADALGIIVTPKPAKRGRK